MKSENKEIRGITTISADNQSLTNQNDGQFNQFDYIRERMVDFNAGCKEGTNITESEHLSNSNLFLFNYVRKN